MVLLENRKARFEYEVIDTYHAGIVLSGAEVKSLRGQHGSLNGSFVKVLSGELFLLNAQISPYPYADNRDYDPKRTRKLLLKKHEIATLQTISQQKGLTLVPLKVISAGRMIKLEFGVARGRKTHEKRAKLRERDLAREAARESF